LRSVTGVLLVVAGLVALGASVAGLAVTATDDVGTGTTVAICAGVVGGILLCIVGADRLTDRGRARLGAAVGLLGVAILSAGVGWIATVWGDDAARTDASAPAGGMIIGGILAIVVGIGTVSRYSGDGNTFLS
jgi:peptidoglycan/LPS O-acetylase OafA/YrhL